MTAIGWCNYPLRRHIKFLSLNPKSWPNRLYDQDIDGAIYSLGTWLEAQRIYGDPYCRDRIIDCILQSEEVPRNLVADYLVLQFAVVI